MSQFGANFMAAAGNSATQILKHFYGPASITSVKEPGEIRVLAADGLQAARVSISGPVSVTTETGSMLATGNLFQVTGGKTLTITRGVGPSAQPVLQLVANTSELNATPGDTISIPFNASRAARVSVELAGPNGIILTTTETSYVSGDNTVTFPLKDSQNKDLPPGAYTATVIAYDGLDRVRSAPVAIAVRAPNARAPGTSGPSGYWVWIGIVLAGIVVVSITTLLVRRRNQPNVNV
jgi:hypothetical protein